MSSLSVAGSIVALAASVAVADTQVRITVENLAPTNGVAFAPLRVGFHNGSFDYFNTGQAGTAASISIAEGGSGVDFFPLFASQSPTGVSGSVGAGPLVPGASASVIIDVDGAANRFFTFGAMVVPSNDHFIGNDSATRFSLFDPSGNFIPTVIEQRVRDIWDNGSEQTDPVNAAFLQIGTNALRTPENGVVRFDSTAFEAYAGLTTAAGYTFDPQLGNPDQVLYRITIEQVPAPATAGLLGLAGLAGLRRRR